MNIIKKYWEIVFYYALLFSPLACIFAGMFYTTSKLHGGYERTPLSLIIFFDLTQFLYLLIAFYFIWKKNKKRVPVEDLLPSVKKYVTVSLFIQYNFIMNLFPAEYTWACSFIFLALIVFYFDVRLMLINTGGYMVSLTIAHLFHPEHYIPVNSSFHLEIIFFRIVALAVTSLILITITYFVEKFLDKIEYESFEKRFYMEQQLDYYQNLDIMDKELRRFRHDIKNHFLCIQSLVENQKFDELEAYFNDLNKSYSSTNLLYFSGNLIIDSILNYHLSHLGNLGVHPVVYGKLPEIKQISSMDLCTIFSNMISNAIKAVSTCSTSSPVLEIAFDYGEKYCSIAVTNTMTPEMVFTSKRKNRNHGHGMYLMKEFTEKNKGMFEQSLENDTLTTIVYLPY